MERAVVRVEVEAEGAGALRVRWELTAPTAVDVAVGASPDGIDHDHAATVDEGVTSCVVASPGDARHFVSVAPHGAGPAVVAAERRVMFEGVQNFRDLGGYRAEGGGRVRWGRLFRSDSLHKLTAADLAAFERLGLGVVIDLRGDRERETHPNPIARAVQVAVTGQPPVDPDAPDERDRSLSGSADGERILRDLYVGMLEHSPALFHRIFTALLEPNGMPAVFHCHAGKDRTGVLAALVLLAVGVSAEDVLDDYELTRRFRFMENQQESYANMIALGMSPEAAAGVLSTPRWAMEDTLQALDAQHGGIERYLTQTVGLTTGQLDALRAALVA
jgi:protein-tyrosine phosphatase